VGGTKLLSQRHARALWIAVILLAVPTALFILYLRPWYWFVGNAPPMSEITRLSDLQTRFNADAGRMRLILLMSPT